jgi:hypothetical protein
MTEDRGGHGPSFFGKSVVVEERRFSEALIASNAAGFSPWVHASGERIFALQVEPYVLNML